MSGLSIAAVPGAATADVDRLEAQVRAQATRFVAPARDGFGFWRGAAAALGQTWHATTPEDLESGPAVAALGSWHLVADARVDNRDELVESLGASRSIGDAEILVAAWVRWGPAAITHVIGDYAFAAWNEETRELALARDAIGLRSLFFAHRNGLVRAASELHVLTRGPLAVEVDVEPDEAARFLVCRHTATGATVFRGIENVAPGEVITFRGKGIEPRRTRVWAPDPFARAPQGDFGAHRERLRDVLTRSLRDRMRSVEPTSFLLSGGVDSTVLTCLAERALPPAKPRRMLHLSQRGHVGDETQDFDRVVAHLGGDAILEDPRSYVERIGPDSDFVAPGELYDITLTMIAPLFARLPEGGRNVLLSGVGSDDILQESGNECITHLAAGRLRAAWSSARRFGPEGAALRYFVREAVRLAVPGPLWRLGRALRPARWVWPACLTPRARARVDAWHRVQARAAGDLPAPDAIQRSIALLYRGAYDLHLQLGRAEYLSRAMGIEQRMPYHDRRVVELMFALPHTLRFDGEQTKPILRAVGDGIAPAENLRRGGESHFGAFIEDARRGPHRAAWEARLRDPVVERAGIIEAGALRTLLSDDPTNEVLSRAMAIEVAYRTLRAPLQPTGEELRDRARSTRATSQGPCGVTVDRAR